MSKTEQPSVYSVTPSFNAKQQTLSFIKDMQAQEYENLTIVIIDDGSTDGTGEEVAKQYPNVVLLKGDGNLWWSGATNLGVEYAQEKGANYILTINNDLNMQPSYLKELVNDALSEPNALFGSLVVYENDPSKVWFAGAYFNHKRGEMEHTNGSIGEFRGKILESDWLSGMGTLIPAGVFRKVGTYDEVKFPQYFGDSDLSVRAKLAGYDLRVSGDAIIVSDVQSAWLHRQIARPHLGMFKDLFTSIRSPYQYKTRKEFYRLYWGKSWRSDLAKLYLWSMRGVYFRLTQAYLKKLIGR